MAESPPAPACVRFGTWAAIAVVVISPLIRVRSGPLFLLVAIALAWQFRQRPRPRVDGALVAAAASVVFAHALATGLATGAATLPGIALPMAVLVAMAHLRVTAAVGGAIVASGAAWCLVGLVAWAALHLGWTEPGPLARPNSANLLDAARVAGVMPSNSLVLCIGLALPWVVHGQWAQKRPGWRWAALGVLIVAACGTLSRGLVSVFLSLCAPLRETGSAWRAVPNAFRALAAVSLLALVPVTWWTIAPTPAATGLEGRPVVLGVRENAYAVLHRAAVRLWVQRPLTGHGPDRFRSTYGQVVSREELAAVWPPMPPRGMLPHSLLLGALAETGLVGVAAWLALAAVALRRLLAALPGSVPHAAGWAVLGLLVASLHVDFELLRSLWVLIGLGLAAARHGQPC